MQQSSKLSIRISLAYMVFASLWILYSDMAVEVMFRDPHMITRVQTYKGVLFVLITGFLLFILVLKSYQRLEQVFQLDGLTGLLNHYMFKLQLSRRLSALGPNERLLIGCLDINNFKELNETLGYDRADQFVLQLSNAIQRFARPGSIIGRLPPDQFVSAREFPEGDNVHERVQGFLELFEKVAGQAGIEATCRIGVAVYPDDGKTAKALLAAATAAVVTAKLNGQAVCYHDKALSEENARRRALVQDLRKAIQEQGLALVYQPKYVIDSGEVSGAEVLLRWHHPVHGFISPAEFIPLAEEHGLMSPITQFVLSQTEKELGDTGLLDGSLKHISVNVSAAEFNELEAMKSLQSHLSQLSRLTRYLRIEITETATLKDIDQSRCIIDTLRDDGVTVSIDDFGTGYTSLAMLKDFAIDEIKIDRSFVNGMNEGRRARTIVQAVIAMALSFEINVVAEGVETEEQLALLKALGCREAQGFLLGAPMAAASLKTHITEKRLPA